MQKKSKILVFILFIFLASNLIAEDENRYKLSISTLELSKSIPQDTLDINLAANGQPVGGVALKFGHDSKFFSIKTILSGEIPDSCGWKIFNSREAAEAGTDGRPLAMWQVLAMAEFGPDSLRAVCNTFGHEASIARLVISLDTNLFSDLKADTLLPIFFYWEDCSDNTIANSRGDSLFISEQVDNLHWSHNDVVGVRFPSKVGAGSKCINSRAVNPPRRKIHLLNGGVLVRTARIAPE